MKNETIIIGVVIISISLIAVQYAKQQSIERQIKIKRDQAVEIQSIKTEFEREKYRDEQERIKKEKMDKKLKKTEYRICLYGANKKYWDYMKLNEAEKDNGEISAPQHIWDQASKNKQLNIKNCKDKFFIK